MPHVITITGPSGAGKSTALRYLLDCVQEYDDLKPVMVPKYTTRPPHDDDQGEVICEKTIPIKCDLVYEQYGARYGLELRTILSLIAKGNSPVVILNDVRAVEDVRNALGKLVKSLFVFMESPTRLRFRELAHTKGLYGKKQGENGKPLECLFSTECRLQSDLEDGDLSYSFRLKFCNHGILLSNNVDITQVEKNSIWWIRDSDADRTYVVEKISKALNIYAGEIDEKELDRRFHKAQDIYRIYIEHIHLFDHVLINNRIIEETVNNSEIFEDLRLQVRQVVRGLQQDQYHPPQIVSKEIPVQRLFIIVGSPGSGKDYLIRAVNDLGAQHAEIVPKHTSRRRWDDDANEMICAGDPGYDLENCDIVYENYGDKYGIKSVRIWKGLSQGIFQVVVVSNVDAINKLRRAFGELVTLVYVHSEIDAEEYQRREEAYGKGPEYIQRRIAEYESAFEVYLANFLAFDHVLIYSGLEEDLYDQIFRLFRAYEIDLGHAATKTPVSDRIWKELESYREPVVLGDRRHLPPRIG